MQRGESLDCKGESVDPMAVRVEGGGDRDVEDVFVELCNEVGGGGDGAKDEGHLFC